MNIKNIFLTIVIAGIVSVVAVSAFRSEKTKVVQGERGVQGQQGIQGEKGDKGDKGVQGERGATGTSGAIGMPQRLGALSGPDLPYNYFSFGGVRRFAGRMTMATATTTICAIQSPAATSSLVSNEVDFSVSSTTASLITIAKATSAFATTTKIGSQFNIAANAKDTIVGSTTPTNGLLFSPNDWLVVGMQGNAGTFSPTGSCQATWETI